LAKCNAADLNPQKRYGRPQAASDCIGFWGPSIAANTPPTPAGPTSSEPRGLALLRDADPPTPTVPAGCHPLATSACSATVRTVLVCGSTNTPFESPNRSITRGYTRFAVSRCSTTTGACPPRTPRAAKGVGDDRRQTWNPMPTNRISLKSRRQKPCAMASPTAP